MASATQTTAGVNGIVAANSKNLLGITSNAAILTANLNTIANNLDTQIKPILQKTSTLTDSLNAMRLGQTVSQLNSSIAGLQGVIKEINQGKGTLGKLAKDDSLYVNLDRTAANIALLMADMKLNPKRYVHFSLFGKKEKKYWIFN
jgi:phospholipid/cholesterol/gamma-HCH transport system substrate-binding protein